MAEKANEIRLATRDEASRQKEIWRLCFGDSDEFIDFFFAHKYKEDETMVLLHNGEVAARLTMLPVKLVTPAREVFHGSMLYAVATHPENQNQGFAGRLMNYTHRFLREKNKAFAVVVPAEQGLFDFYRKHGYQEGFYLTETLLTKDKLESLLFADAGRCVLQSVTPQEYNLIRNQILNGCLYISYHDEEVSYQKRLSQFSGGDILRIDTEKTPGLAAIERLSPKKILVKEILAPGHMLTFAAKEISKRFPAEEYIFRTTAFLRGSWEGNTRPFAMIRTTPGTGLKITPGDLGYLGLAFD
ncbi:MAG: GNAT family N-acetyltransferase [Bacillota bacterium]|jgi:predicted N-acetyltransferase YhbS